MPLLCVAILLYAIAIQWIASPRLCCVLRCASFHRLAFALLLLTSLFLCETAHLIAVPLRYLSWLISAIAVLLLAYRCVAVASRFRSLRGISAAVLCRTTRSHCSTERCASRPSRCAAGHLDAVAHRAYYAPFLANLLLPPITLPRSSSSSHRKRPLPEFRHWPMPRSMP